MGKFFRARGGFAEPEGDAGWLAVGIFDADGAVDDLKNFPGGVAELENIAGETFNGEILVDRADECLSRFEHDAVIGVIGNRAAGGEREQARAAPAAQAMVHGVVMNQGGAMAAFGAKALG